jgi:hypothetical protein
MVPLGPEAVVVVLAAVRYMAVPEAAVLVFLAKEQTALAAKQLFILGMWAVAVLAALMALAMVVRHTLQTPEVVRMGEGPAQ